MPPAVTYSSNRPLDLQEKVITMIKKSVNTSTKNMREHMSTSKLFQPGKSPSRNRNLKKTLTEYLPSKITTSTVTNSFLDNQSGDGYKEVTFYSSQQPQP